jgi:hypothetical protein
MEKKAPNADDQVADITDEKDRIISVFHNSLDSQVEKDDVCECIDDLGAKSCCCVV